MDREENWNWNLQNLKFCPQGVQTVLPVVVLVVFCAIIDVIPTIPVGQQKSHNFSNSAIVNCYPVSPNAFTFTNTCEQEKEYERLHPLFLVPVKEKLIRKKLLLGTQYRTAEKYVPSTGYSVYLITAPK